MSTEGLAYGDRSPAHERRPAYGDGQLAYEPDERVEARLGRGVELRLALAIAAPVVAAYVVVGYAIYVLVDAVV